MLPVLRARLGDYPAVAVVGPRQCGKTTLARSLGGRYFDLEQETDRLRLDLTWEDTTAGRELVVLDEAQAWPAVFPRLRGTIDADRGRNGRFLLLGSVVPYLTHFNTLSAVNAPLASVSRTLTTQVSESLAGRLSVIELTPLLWSELTSDRQRQRLWLFGGYPDGGVLNGKRFPVWQGDYLNLLAQRDLPTWGLTARPQTTQRLLQMLAAVHGQEWNASQLGKSLGLSYHTVNGYLDYLEGAFLVRRLPPYHANIRKRLVKRPKVYWRDTGLLHALLNTSAKETLLSEPWVGASWEGFVINQVLGALQCSGRRFDPFHLRTSDQREIDLLVQVDSELWALEIKLTTSPGPEDLARLNANADLVGAHRRFLVCQSKEYLERGSQVVCNLERMLGYIEG